MGETALRIPNIDILPLFLIVEPFDSVIIGKRKNVMMKTDRLLPLTNFVYGKNNFEMKNGKWNYVKLRLLKYDENRATTITINHR